MTHVVRSLLMERAAIMHYIWRTRGIHQVIIVALSTIRVKQPNEVFHNELLTSADMKCHHFI